METNVPLQGQVHLVTGATSGIGRVTAGELARRGAHVVIASRSEDRCRKTAAQIRAETGSSQVDYLVADLSSRSQVRRLAQDFRSRFERLDVLVNNAGGFFMRRRLSPDGIELTFALNHLSYFLLTNLLLGLLRSSAPARIVNVASAAHLRGKLAFEDLERQRRYDGMDAYAQSKLANILFTYELDRRLNAAGQSPPVTVNTLHPGFVASGFAKNNGLLARLALSIAGLFARSPEQGAETSVYLAASPEVAGLSGKYFFDCQPIRSSPASYDPAAARRLWEISAEMTGLDPNDPPPS